MYLNPIYENVPIVPIMSPLIVIAAYVPFVPFVSLFFEMTYFTPGPRLPIWAMMPFSFKSFKSLVAVFLMHIAIS